MQPGIEHPGEGVWLCSPVDLLMCNVSLSLSNVLKKKSWKHKIVICPQVIFKFLNWLITPSLPRITGAKHSGITHALSQILTCPSEVSWLKFTEAFKTLSIWPKSHYLKNTFLVTCPSEPTSTGTGWSTLWSQGSQNTFPPLPINLHTSDATHFYQSVIPAQDIFPCKELDTLVWWAPWRWGIYLIKLSFCFLISQLCASCPQVNK